VTWSIPICLTYPTSKKKTATTCTLLAQKTATVALEGKKCPKWLVANPGARGYFRVAYPAKLLETTLAKGTLSTAERFTLVGPDTVKWEARFEDASTWEKPWAFTMPLKRDTEAGGQFEYACHEGNRGLANILSAARAEEKAGK
jgi:aminopeptidase N